MLAKPPVGQLVSWFASRSILFLCLGQRLPVTPSKREGREDSDEFCDCAELPVALTHTLRFEAGQRDVACQRDKRAAICPKSLRVPAIEYTVQVSTTITNIFRGSRSTVAHWRIKWWRRIGAVL